MEALKKMVMIKNKEENPLKDFFENLIVDKDEKSIILELMSNEDIENCIKNLLEKKNVKK